MPTACVEEGDSVLEWGYLLQGCGLTRLLGPSLYLWASFWNYGAKSRTVLKKKKYQSQKSGRHHECRKSWKNRTTYKVHSHGLGGNFAHQLEMVSEEETPRSFCWSSIGSVLLDWWKWSSSNGDSSHGGTAVSAALQGALLHVHWAALGLSVSRTCHLGAVHGKAMGHKWKREPIWLWGHTKTSPLWSSKTQAGREANCSL